MSKKKEKIESNSKTLFKLADGLVSDTKILMRQAKSEEDLRIGFEKVLEPTLSNVGVKTSPRYERGSDEARTIYRGRPDAVHGQVIIEYESPKSFSSKRNVEHAHNQLIGYLSAESKASKINRLVGVGFDGEQIFFVQYYGEIDKKIDKSKFIKRGPYTFDTESAQTLLIHLRALARLPLTARNLADKFGPDSDLAPEAVSAFADALEYWGGKENERVRSVFFNEWKRLFGIVYGEQFTGGHQEKEAEALSKLYNVGEETDFQELLFSVHTYFAFLMKLIAAELLTLQETTFSSSFTSELTHASEDQLKEKLIEIEEGGIYARQGIRNFLEGDFFRWYLDAWSPGLERIIRKITRTLSEFEPATSTLDPNSTRDLLKKLYQYLVPQEVRHRLGEYYTPDWLAELIIKEVGYNGNTLKKVLDPACGSGTFLVLAIQKAKEYGQKNREKPLETAKRIVHNIWGFDLNPLAVIAARTNYLFALGDLVSKLQNFEIPIYLTDSVLTPAHTTGNLFGNFLEVATSVGKFQVPAEWVRDKGFLLSNAAPLIEEMVKNQYSLEEAMGRFQREGLLFSSNEEIVKNLYSRILELEKQNKNGIWARFLKNVFAPMVAGKFDFVIGNPPWIRWDYLAKEYREATRHLWQDYGLFSLKGYAQMLGGAKPDFSMLFVYSSSDYYLKDGAKLGFLITQEVFKSKGAGEGFRRFQLGDKKHLRVIKAHDLVSIQPFEGATNKTAAIILKKGEKTQYPLPYILWTRKKGLGKVATDKSLNEITNLVHKKRLTARPLGSDVGPWQTIESGRENLFVIEGKNYYKARAGAWADPYGIFWLEVKQKLSDGNLLISNLVERGKTEIQKIEEKIESDLVHPAIAGPNIKRWGIEQDFFVLLVNDKDSPMRGYFEKTMKDRWPLTFNYLNKFRTDLSQRTSYKKFHLKSKAPFYSQYNIGKYTFSRYKVVWKRMTTDIVAAVISEVKTLFNYKQVIPLDTTVIFSVDEESEAHYLCAIINSNSVREFIKSFSSAGRGFGTPSIMQYVGIPEFNSKDKIHQQLVKISKKCHQFKKEKKEKEIEKLEKENDRWVKQLFDIKK